MSLALSLCQYVLRPRRGLAQASPSLEAPRLHALETPDLLHQESERLSQSRQEGTRGQFWESTTLHEHSDQPA